MNTIKSAINSLRNNKMILIFDADNREGETDMVMSALDVKPRDVARFRKDGGGLICVAIPSDVADKLGLPYMSDILKYAKLNGLNLNSITEKIGDLRYDTKSSFSIWVNHRDTFTGITDNDRALTINKIGSCVEQKLKGNSVDFGKEFRSPGHVSILRAAPNLVLDRRGHTELSLALAYMANITPAMVVCEMLDDRTGKALSKKDAKKYAIKHDITFVEGRDIIKEYKKSSIFKQI
ncbi:MAG: 3,4-dihydroxy-2-butanone-4-phosphate synthase [Methanosarcinales archaeon]